MPAAYLERVFPVCVVNQGGQAARSASCLPSNAFRWSLEGGRVRLPSRAFSCIAMARSFLSDPTNKLLMLYLSQPQGGLPSFGVSFPS
eukprot:scaffold320111_cov30-Tisochrysis_lutea.AAC.1